MFHSYYTVLYCMYRQYFILYIAYIINIYICNCKYCTCVYFYYTHVALVLRFLSVGVHCLTCHENTKWIITTLQTRTSIGKRQLTIIPSHRNEPNFDRREFERSKKQQASGQLHQIESTEIKTSPGEAGMKRLLFLRERKGNGGRVGG